MHSKTKAGVFLYVGLRFHNVYKTSSISVLSAYQPTPYLRRNSADASRDRGGYRSSLAVPRSPIAHYGKSHPLSPS